jgi:hypothetical protein
VAVGTDSCYLFGGTGPGNLYADIYHIHLRPNLVELPTSPASSSTPHLADQAAKNGQLLDIFTSTMLALQHSEAERKDLGGQVTHLQVQLESHLAHIKSLEASLGDAKMQLLIASETSPASKKSQRRPAPAASSPPSAAIAEHVAQITQQLQRLEISAATATSLSTIENDLMGLVCKTREMRAQAIARELELLEQRRDSMMAHSKNCVCCTSAASLVVFLPCRHQIVCKQCRPQIDRCPTCRSAIDTVIEPF